MVLCNLCHLFPIGNLGLSWVSFPCLLEHPEYRYDKLFLLIYVAVHLCIYTVTVSFCLSVYSWMSDHNLGTPRLIWLKYHLGFSVEPRVQGKFSAWFKISDFTGKLGFRTKLGAQTIQCRFLLSLFLHFY